jgi:hypothetical protein
MGRATKRSEGLGAGYFEITFANGWGVVVEVWVGGVGELKGSGVSGSPRFGISRNFRRSFFNRLSTETLKELAIFFKFVRLGLALASS